MNPRSGLAHPSLSTCSHSFSTRPRRTRWGSDAASRRSAARRPLSSGATRSTSRPPSGSIRLARHGAPRVTTLGLPVTASTRTPRAPTLGPPTAATLTRAGATPARRSRPGCACCGSLARKAACVAMA
uniref:ATP sulfurylase n=1 Tax=Arundo donax TaxID=35708 RepID=A0A0A8ZXE2_ARUDO